MEGSESDKAVVVEAVIGGRFGDVDDLHAIAVRDFLDLGIIDLCRAEPGLAAGKPRLEAARARSSFATSTVSGGDNRPTTVTCARKTSTTMSGEASPT